MNKELRERRKGAQGLIVRPLASRGNLLMDSMPWVYYLLHLLFPRLNISKILKAHKKRLLAIVILFHRSSNQHNNISAFFFNLFCLFLLLIFNGWSLDNNKYLAGTHALALKEFCSLLFLLSAKALSTCWHIIIFLFYPDPQSNNIFCKIKVAAR